MIHYIVSPEHFCCRRLGGVLPVKLKHADGATVNLSIRLLAFYHGSVIERFNHVLVCRVSCITSLFVAPHHTTPQAQVAVLVWYGMVVLLSAAIIFSVILYGSLALVSCTGVPCPALVYITA